jgi:TadE-like protein
VEFVICTVVMVLLLLAVVQVALYFHARAVATTAARHGLDRARVLDGSTGDAVASTNAFLAQAGGGLEHRGVQASRGATTASVTVEGEVVSVVPGVRLPVDVTVRAPVERLVP